MSTSRIMAYFIWIIASIFYAYQYILRVMPSIMFDEIMQQFHIDAAIFGQFSGLYYIGYTLMHLPIGIMLDRWGPRKIMSCCMLLTVIGLLPIIFTENWIYLIAGRILIGIGSSAASLGAFKIIRMTFQEKHFTRMLSFSVTIGLIGAIYGGGPVSSMCSTLGYKSVVQIFAISGLLLAFFTYLIVPEIDSTNQASIISNIKALFSNKKVILLCCFAGFMVGPNEGFVDVWGATFLKQVYGFDASISSYLPSMIYVGMCFGGPALSFIADKTGRYLGSIITAGIVMLIVFTMLVAKLLTVNGVTIGFLLVGICCAYQIIAIYKASTYVPENMAGLTTAIANMIIMSFGYGFNALIGIIIDANKGAEVAQQFIYGIGVIPLALVIGIIGFVIFSFKERENKHDF